jgi:hypothetical protein
MPLRAIAERLAQLGYLNANGKTFAAQSVSNMVTDRGAPKAPAPLARSPVPSAPVREPLPPLPPDASIEDRLRRRLADLDALREEARGAESFTAAVTAAKGSIALELQIEATRRPPPAEDPTAGMTDEEITAGIVAEVSGWSDDVLDAVEEAIALRRGVRTGGTVLRVVGSAEG